jgi:hypothetical protein
VLGGGLLFGYVCWTFWGGEIGRNGKIGRDMRKSQGVFGLTRKEASVGTFVKVLGFHL